MSAAAWSHQRYQEEALVIVSTRAGQNAITGVKRVERHATIATRSNPAGLRVVSNGPKMANPLLTRLVDTRTANPMRRICSTSELTIGVKGRDGRFHVQSLSQFENTMAGAIDAAMLEARA
jgi:hypothetical protein